MGDLVTKVPVEPISGIFCEGLPEDPIGNSPPNHSILGQEQEVQSGLPVQLKGLENALPKGPGTFIPTSLDLWPLSCGHAVEVLQELPFKVLKSRIFPKLQEAQGVQSPGRIWQREKALRYLLGLMLSKGT